MAITATYNQITSATNTWIGTFQIGGVYYAIKDPNLLYRIETDGTATYLRAISGDVWGDVNCDGTYIYRASSTTIFKINPADGSVPYSSACSNLRCLGIDTAGARIFGLTNAGALYVFTTNNMTQYYVNNVGAATYGGKMVYLNGALYIPVYGGKIKKYVVDTGVTTTLANSLSAGWLCLDTDGQYIYGTVDGGRIYRIYPDDSSLYEEIQGDSAGRFWYSNTYYNGQIWANAYNGYCYKIVLPIPAVPTSSITTSTIYSDTAVTLSCSTSGATIKYTTDGTTPGLSNGTTYSGAITINKTTTLKFCAIKDGYVTAGVDVIYTLGYAYNANFTEISTLSRNYSLLFPYGGLIYTTGDSYSGINDTKVYTINPTTGVETLVFDCGEKIKGLWTNGTKILLGFYNYVKEYDMSGTLLYTHNTPSTYTGWTGATCFFQLDSKIYYLNRGAFSGQHYIWEITLGSTTAIQADNYYPTWMYVANNKLYSTNLNGSLKQWVRYESTSFYFSDDYSYTLIGASAQTELYPMAWNGSKIYCQGVNSSNSNDIYVIDVDEKSLYAIAETTDFQCSGLAWYNGYLYTPKCSTKKWIKIDVFSRYGGSQYIRTGGSWKKINSIYVMRSGTWTLASEAYKKSKGLWNRLI